MFTRKALAVTAVVALALIGLAAPALAKDHRDDHHTRHTADRHDGRSNSQWWFESSRGNNKHDRDRDRDREDRRDRDNRDDDDSDDDSSDSGSDVIDSGGTSTDVSNPGGTVLTGDAKTVQASLTGYSRADNNPPGSAKICCGVIHSEASGTGTADDPITAAGAGSGAGIEVKPGLRVYIGKLKKYFIIEDSGATPNGKFRMDLWVDGKGFPDSSAEKCMSFVTGDTQVIVNPPTNLPVGKVGPLTGPAGCDI